MHTYTHVHDTYVYSLSMLANKTLGLWRVLHRNVWSMYHVARRCTSERFLGDSRGGIIVPHSANEYLIAEVHSKI